MSDDICYPKLKLMIVNDWAVFLMVFLPLFFSVFMIIVYVSDEFPFIDYSFFDYITSFFLFSILVFCMWPFILWWYYQLSKVSKKNIVIDAKVLGSFGSGLPFSLYINVEYEFDYNGKHVKHHAALVPNSRTRDILKREKIEVLFDPSSNISFIKDIYTK